MFDRLALRRYAEPNDDAALRGGKIGEKSRLCGYDKKGKVFHLTDYAFFACVDGTDKSSNRIIFAETNLH